jgi:hypothetical protein
MDINERYELLQGTVDFKVTSVCARADCMHLVRGSLFCCVLKHVCAIGLHSHVGSPLQEYYNREPKACRYLFLIDSSFAAIQSGMMTCVVVTPKPRPLHHGDRSPPIVHWIPPFVPLKKRADLAVALLT